MSTTQFSDDDLILTPYDDADLYAELGIEIDLDQIDDDLILTPYDDADLYAELGIEIDLDTDC